MPCYALDGLVPVVDPSAFVHPDAVLIGDVIVGPGCYVGPCASLRGDFGRLVLQAGVNLANETLTVTTEPAFDPAALTQAVHRAGYELATTERRLAVEADGVHHYNTSILVNKNAEMVGKYRKIHLPGHAEHEPWRRFQHLEKRYFEPGDLGFPTFDTPFGRIGILICYDRHFPEGARALGLNGAEIVFNP